MKFKTTFKIGNTTIMLVCQSMPTPKAPTVGIASRVLDSCFHVLFMDYDYISEDILDNELTALQEMYELGDIHLFKMDRPNAYHCICLDMLPLHEIYKILMCTSCDLAFKLAPRLNEMRSWVLRSYSKGDREKPKFYKTLHSAYHNNYESVPHKLYLNVHYDCHIELVKPFEGKNLLMTTYLTAMRLGGDKHG